MARVEHLIGQGSICPDGLEVLLSTLPMPQATLALPPSSPLGCGVRSQQRWWIAYGYPLGLLIAWYLIGAAYHSAYPALALSYQCERLAEGHGNQYASSTMPIGYTFPRIRLSKA